MSRDRDASGRPRNARPRDDLGRPLSRTSDTNAEPDPPALPPRDALAEAQRLLDAGKPFAAHEVLEAVWKATPEPGRALWRGLAQLAVGVTHHGRGNDAGAAALLRRAADTLATVADEAEGVPVSGLRDWAMAAAADLDRAGPMPRLVGQAADDRA